MIKSDYEKVEWKLENNTASLNLQLIPSLLQFVSEAKEIIFPNGRFKKFKFFQFNRIWKLVKLTIQFVNTLIAIFK